MTTKKLKIRKPSQPKATAICVSGARSTNGTRYVRFEHGKTVRYEKFAAFQGDGRPGFAALAEQGIVIVTKKQQVAVLEEIAALDPDTGFEKMNLLDRTGWSGSHYVMPDGTVISPHDKELNVATTFAYRSRRRATKGTLEDWKQRVAQPLVGMQLPMFAISTAFIGPLLRFTRRVRNPGWELSGNRGCGKTTIQAAAASVWDDSDRHVDSFDATRSGLERLMELRADCFLVLDELNLFMSGSTEKAKAAARRELPFQLTNGKPKLRYTDTDVARRCNFAWLTSANDALADVLADIPQELVLPALDRWLTLQVPNDDMNGVFSPLPTGVADSGKVASRLTLAIEKNYGVAGSAFVTQLVAYHAEHSKKLKRVVDQKLANFREAANLSGADGSITRVLDAFGLAYVAASLAAHFEVLPIEYDDPAAALHCFQMHRQVQTAGSHAAESLKALLKDPRLIEASDDDVRSLTDDQVDSRPLLFGWNATYELVLTEKAFQAVFPRPKQVLMDSAVRDRLELEPADKKRGKVRRWVTAMRHERVFAFDVSDWVKELRG